MEYLEVVTLKITDLSRGGAGVSRDESGRVIFVPFTLPGDEVRAGIVEAEKRYAQAELIEILKPSPDRQPPECPAFGRCGGCQWQHIPYSYQWKAKAGGVRHALERQGIEVPTDWHEIPAHQIWNYRNRIQLRGFQEQIGFFERASRTLVPVNGCPIAREEINAVWEETREEGKKLPQEYKVEIEVLPDGTIRKSWNARHAAAGFRQLHDEQNDRLREFVSSCVSPGRVLYDLFGGAGNLSLGLAGLMKEIHCVDIGSPDRAPDGTPANYHFYRFSVLPWLVKRVKSRLITPGASAILDPPRIGLGDHHGSIAEALEKIGVDEIIAVGCDLDAWVRDVNRFIRRGWKFTRAGALDFFPQTPHVESIAVLRR